MHSGVVWVFIIILNNWQYSASSIICTVYLDYANLDYLYLDYANLDYPNIKLGCKQSTIQSSFQRI